MFLVYQLNYFTKYGCTFMKFSEAIKLGTKTVGWSGTCNHRKH